MIRLLLHELRDDIHVLQSNLTRLLTMILDWRWWGDQHHGNSGMCHEGNIHVPILSFNSYRYSRCASRKPLHVLETWRLTMFWSISLGTNHLGLNLYVAASILLLLGQFILLLASVYFIGTIWNAPAHVFIFPFAHIEHFFRISSSQSNERYLGDVSCFPSILNWVYVYNTIK